MGSRIEKELPIRGGARIPPKLPGEISGRKIDVLRKGGFYCVTVPKAIGAEALSLTGSFANQLTFRPVVFTLSTVGWLAGKSLQYAGRVTEFVGKVFQSDLMRRVGMSGSKYTEAYFQKAQGVRSAIGNVVDMGASYVPLVSGPLVTIEKGERAAESAMSGAKASVLSRVCNIVPACIGSLGSLIEHVGEGVSLVSKKVTDLTSLGMSDPSILNHIFQDFRDRMDSYAFNLLEAQEPPRPVIQPCTEGDFKHFIKLGKHARRKIFQQVSSSSWLRVADETRSSFVDALKKKGIKRTPDDLQALRIMYSAYLSLVGLKKEREKLQVSESQYQNFLALPADEQDIIAFSVLSSPMWDVPLKDCDVLEEALKRMQEAHTHGLPTKEEDKKLVKELLGMHKQLPNSYLQTALTPTNCDQKLLALDPARVRIRIMNILREYSNDLEPNERRVLAKYRKIQQESDWNTINSSEQKTLEKLLFRHFNRLHLRAQSKLYDLVPEDIWALPSKLRNEFFFVGQKLLFESDVHEFDTVFTKDFMEDFENVKTFVKVLNDTLGLSDRVKLHQMVVPPTDVIAMTREQLLVEIESVKARLGKGDIEDVGRHQLSLYLKTLEATLENREYFVPIEKFETSVSKEQVFAKSVAMPEHMATLQRAIGSDIVSSGLLYSSAKFVGAAEEWSGTVIGKAFETLGKGLGWTAHPTLVKCMFGAFSVGISLFNSESWLLPGLKVLGIEKKFVQMEEQAAQVFAHLVKMSQSLEGMVLNGVVEAHTWLDTVSKAMTMVGDPSSSLEQIRSASQELQMATDGVCAAAKTFKEGSIDTSAFTETATMISEMCSKWGVKGLVLEAEGKMPTVAPEFREMATKGLQAFRKINIIEPNPSILNSVKKLFGIRHAPVEIQAMKDFAEKLTILEENSGALERINSVKGGLEMIPEVAKWMPLQAIAQGYQGVARPLLDIIKDGLEAEKKILELGNDAVLQHLKWVDLAREVGKYSEEGGEKLLKGADTLIGQLGLEPGIGKTLSYALPLVSVSLLGTSGLVLTPLLMAFLANDFVPGVGAYLAPRLRPMWKYLGARSKESIARASEVAAETTVAIGKYLQKAINSGRYVDEKRIENFLHAISKEDREFVASAVLKSPKVSQEEAAEIENEWIRSRKHELSPAQEKALVSRILLGFDDLTAEDFLAMDALYFSRLAPYVQERLVDIVARYHPLTLQEKRSPDFLKILVDRFVDLPKGQKAEINNIPSWEYHQLTEEQQRELRFLIVHSQRHIEAMKQEKKEQLLARGEIDEEEEVELEPGELLKEFELEPKGEDLRAFLAEYRTLTEKDIASITPQQLLGAGDAKILHALSILDRYHARWIRSVAEKDGRDIMLLKDIIQLPSPRSPSMEAQKKRLVEILASLCHQLPEHQQRYLLDMTEHEVEEVCRDAQKLEICLEFLSMHITDPGNKETLAHILSTYRQKGIDAKRVASLFNSLLDTQKAEYRQRLQPRTDVIEETRKALISTNVELLQLTEVAEKNKFSLENLVCAAELLRQKGKEKLSQKDEDLIQRYELNGSAVVQKLEVIEKKIGQLLAFRTKLVGALERAGVRDIPPLPLEEIEKNNPSSKSELLLISRIIGLEIESIKKLIQSQTSREGLLKVWEVIGAMNARRSEEGNLAVESMERQIREKKAEAEHAKSGIARAKATAETSLIAKHVKFIQAYLKTYIERISELSDMVQTKRAELES